MVYATLILRGISEDVAPAADGVDDAGVAVFFELVAEVVDVDVEDVGEAVVFGAPDGFVELGAGEDLPGAGHEGAEEGELAGGEVEDVAGAGRAAGGGVELDVGEAEDGFGARAGAADDGTDAGEQFGEAEGFGDVVVGAAVEAFDAVGDRVAGGDHDDGDVGAGLAQLADE